MMNNIEITIPKTLQEALELISGGNEGIGIIAGGTDVVAGMRQGSNRFGRINQLVDVNHIKEMKGITGAGGIVTIGAAETFSGIISNKIIRKELPLLAKACGTIGSVQIRNRATIAGNFVNNAPCADTVPVLLAYDSTIEIKSLAGKRELPLAEFLKAPYRTQLNSDEIVTSIKVPLPKGDFKGDFYKLGRRRAVAISRITLALLIEIKESRINRLRIASGAVTPIGTRFNGIEKEFEGKTADEKTLKAIASRLGERVIEVTGLRWSSEYKLPVVQQICYQMLYSAVYGGGK